MNVGGACDTFLSARPARLVRSDPGTAGCNDLGVGRLIGNQRHQQRVQPYAGPIAHHAVDLRARAVGAGMRRVQAASAVVGDGLPLRGRTLRNASGVPTRLRKLIVVFELPSTKLIPLMPHAPLAVSRLHVPASPPQPPRRDP